ncbi:MAG: SDR family oxidoreductase [Phenylobacterium sp.]|uniref:SDR family NAD(P)-dependent oxidoreductase n=1 Tax=Phenylobacterium sp. TaxID=1871053 RepID=UPI001A5C21ED|nr:SDR family oxidoreductase [Phenylobacterium sp.]MBL8554679.1 SDR family oxidoreductase [Phenylobacterium sp.]
MSGRKVLIVGGGQRVFDAATDPIGNGRAMSVLCAREGAHVAVADYNRESAQQTVEMIAAEGGRAFAIEADICDEGQVSRMVEAAVDGLGGLDGLVLNVGTFGQTGLRTFDLAEWDAILNANLRGPMLCCRHALDRMADDSSIVFISSIAAKKAGSQLVPYDASKAGLAGLARHVALEGLARGIRVNTVMPGLVDTPNGRITTAGRPERANARGPFGRQATGWEIAYAVLFFLSEESAFVHAQTLAVDSGVTGL